MHRRILLTGLALAVAGCARERGYSAPAPPGALDCAVSRAEELGYQRMAGGAEEGFVRMSQRLEPVAPEPPDGPDALSGPDRAGPDRPEAPVENQLVLSHAEGRLSVQVVDVEDGAAEVPGRSDAITHAQIILTACSS